MSMRILNGALLCAVLALISIPTSVHADGEILEFSCPSCGYRQRLPQGSDAGDLERNVQSIIVVCERSREIRSIRIPLDPGGTGQRGNRSWHGSTVRESPNCWAGGFRVFSYPETHAPFSQ